LNKLRKYFELLCSTFGLLTNKYPDGQAIVGWMCEHGKGTEADAATAKRHYELAAKNGNRDGMVGYARLTADKETPTAEECQTAMDYIKELNESELTALIPTLEEKQEAAQNREAEEAREKQRRAELDAELQTAQDAYKTGDYEKALELFQKAAEQGHKNAQFNCGYMYSRGKGTEEDKPKALYWYEKAAEQGHGRACYNIARFYQYGVAVDKNLDEALRWAEKAEETGLNSQMI
jgi:hypothetical protein